MNVQLFNPPVSYYAGVHYRMLPCMSLPILTTLLQDAGHYAEVVDLEALGMMPETFAGKFAGQRSSWPDVVGFTSLTTQAHGARDCIKQLRKVGFTGTVVVGGIHATTEPEEVAAWEGVDLVITGECEANFVEILESGARGIVQGVALPIEDVPSPTWDHHTPSISSYWGNMAMLRPNPGIAMWTRGCPYSCIFCSDFIFYGRPTQFRPPDKIEREWKDLYNHGCRRIYVYDDELYGVKLPVGWMKEVADRLEQYGMTWVTQGRCSRHHITKELMQDAYRAGCRTIFWGLESFSPKVLKAIKKVLTEEDIWHTLRIARECGIDQRGLHDGWQLSGDARRFGVQRGRARQSLPGRADPVPPDDRMHHDEGHAAGRNTQQEKAGTRRTRRRGHRWRRCTRRRRGSLPSRSSTTCASIRKYARRGCQDEEGNRHFRNRHACRVAEDRCTVL